MKLRTTVCALLAFVLTPGILLAQETPRDSADRIRVFVDCFFCDTDFLKTEMGWVDYMRDRADAQVHILATQQGTGGGGSSYTFNFIGLREFAGVNDTLQYVATANDTEDVTRRGIVRVIKLGMTPFLARTALGQQLQITMPTAAGVTPAATAAVQHDPWNFWTFRVGLSGGAFGESNSGSYNTDGSLSANRTTEDWKISLSTNGSYREQFFTFPVSISETELRDTTITTISRSAYFSSLVVKSLTPHLSAGVRAGANTSTFGNISLSYDISPAIEFDVFPYSESNTRMFTLTYSAGLRSFDYRETTLYGETAERVPQHSLGASYSTRMPWGSVFASADFNQYLHRTKFYSANIGGGLSDIRLFKGFSLSMFGDYSMVRDQISLPLQGATPEEVLLHQREIATDYRYSINMSIGYRFGSIFNNVVNPRFGGGGGTVFFF